MPRRRPRTTDSNMLREAVGMSWGGFPAPNPHVGCVIAQGDQIVGKGFHDHAGGPHAEIVALSQAGELARGATVYVTMEPCNHHGRTGACSDALISAGVARVVYIVPDPNPMAQGGADRLREAGITVEALPEPSKRFGTWPRYSDQWREKTSLPDQEQIVLEAESANRAWLTAVRRKRPYVVVKAAIGMDGRIAMADGRSKWLTSENARKYGMRLRAEYGCVLVGARTVQIDNPRLTARVRGVKNQPLRVIMSREEFDLAQYALSGEEGQTIFVPENVEAALGHLYERGVTSLLVEGGAQTHTRFLESGYVDEVNLFVAPRILGNGPVWASPQQTSDPLAETPEWDLVGAWGGYAGTTLIRYRRP